MCDGGWREENMDLHEEIRELEAEIERLRADADRLTAEVAVQVRRAIKAESERDGDLLAENERLRKLMLIVDEMVGEDIKAYCSEQTNREWREAISELEES